ncbi:FAD-dependent oxidoreductase [Nocardioides islandensis]|jgi:4-methylaminobutanoate oxidase (formaldehyde-forming)|uniref:FAD-dependent oxidoreductase n=1 Tax=Nocardioides islandensis TaxID=433663 RepID=A0A930YK90_9ACTN|nr:FAD-dependent oxidoreductase [Nocardioides islandensis]MBF4765824.1 FAD-dependent oxidoreductase [Nocardioides islandensis]
MVQPKAVEVSSTTSVPGRAEIVIVGGGVVGCSVAYHLTRLGRSDVVLLEKGLLSSGTTWHAAGIVGQLRNHTTLTRMMLEGSALYATLEDETGLSTGWNQSGALWVASTSDRVVQLRRTIDVARAQGLEAHFVDQREAARMWPQMRSEDLVGGVWLPHDAKANPTDVTQALARGARAGGASIYEGVKVTGIDVVRGRVRGVRTSHGDIECEVVVNCAGQWAKAVAASIGVTVPLYSAEHYYVVTEAVEGLDRTTPTLRDPDGFVYFKEEVGGLLMGGFEPNAKPWVASEDIPEPFEFQLLPEDWEQFAPMMDNAVHRVPAMEEVGVRKFYNGPESFTPDHNFIMGEAPEVLGFFVAAGFNSSGIAFGGGAGSALARWIVSGEPDMDMTPVDIRRFASFQNNRDWLRSRVTEIVGLHFAMAWPNREPESSRPIRCSPVHGLLEQAGACFGTKLGWERPNWFAPEGTKPVVEYSWGRQNWFPFAAAEHRAARESVALFDQTSFAKYVVRGREATAALQWLCSNDVDVPVGKIVYTGVLNDQGGYEADLTLTRTAWNEYLVVTSSGQAVHDLDVLRRGIDPERHAEVVDVTSTYAVFSVMGPRSRAVLQELTSEPLDNDTFPFGSSRLLNLAGVTVRANRLTYVGELGWELYVPTEVALEAYQRLMEAGDRHGMRLGGYYAIESLRLEKGYRAWGRELTPETTPVEAGLLFACKLSGDVAFRGRPAVEKHRRVGVRRRLVTLQVEDPDAYAWGNELLLRDGRPVGFATSAAFGHTVGSVVMMGYVERTDGGDVDAEWLRTGQYQTAIGGELFDARMSLRPLYDPTGERIKA